MMLSLVSERAANFIKLYFQSKEIYIPFVHKTDGKWNSFLKVKLEILAYKQPTVMAEKEREYRVMIVNILVGILIATLANANFFEIVKDISSKKDSVEISIKGILVDGFNMTLFVGALYMLYFLWSISIILFSRLHEHESSIEKHKFKKPFISWIFVTIAGLFIFKISEEFKWNLEQEVNFIAIVRHVAGFIVTGMFLSLGSKFWHDLLDVLFKLKNTQQVLSDSKTYTNYDSADKLITLANTSQYDIAEKLFDEYKDAISTIEGIVSFGLNTIIDERTRLFKKVIEVEYITSDAQTKLFSIQNKSSIVLNYNTFYLKDYLNLYYTKTLEAVNAIDNSPQCYAHNDSTGNESNRGSFNVVIIDEKYYAISNLHVFADKSELKKYHNNKSYLLKKTDVKFVINEELIFFGKLDLNMINFEEKNGESQDFAACEIGMDLYNSYNDFIKNYINPKKLTIDKMEMFGAASKYKKFNMISSFKTTDCTVDYKGFTRKMNLIKVNDIKVISGDSGSFVYYKQKINDTTTFIRKGIIVAKSDNFSYMFRCVDL